MSRKIIMQKVVWIINLASLFFLISSSAYSGTYVSLDARADAEQSFWLIEEENAVASIILFAGGDGKLKLDGHGIRKLQNNFVVRNRNNLAGKGYNVAVIDVPSDQHEMFYFRTTEEHAIDIKSVIKHMRDKFKKPVWLIGTSRGTTSVANVAARLNKADGPDGVVFTASISSGGSHGESMNDVSLDKIKQPVLFVHHEDDQCHVCPPEDITSLANDMSNAKFKEIKMFSGGNTEGRECGSQSHHGFLGIDDEVIKFISDWIKSH